MYNIYNMQQNAITHSPDYSMFNTPNDSMMYSQGSVYNDPTVVVNHNDASINQKSINRNCSVNGMYNSEFDVERRSG